MHAQRVKGDRAGHDQLVVAVIVGERRRSEGVGREQLGVGVGHPARRLVEAFSLQVGAERPQQLAGRALSGRVVDLARRGMAR